jgi:hypothetical protein
MQQIEFKHGHTQALTDLDIRFRPGISKPYFHATLTVEVCGSGFVLVVFWKRAIFWRKGGGREDV